MWNIQIDSDILDTIKDKFPAWFSPVATTSKHTPFEAFGNFPSLIAMAHHGLPSLSELNDDVLSSGSGSSESRQSPPKAIVDSSPLAMDKNRECEYFYFLKHLKYLKYLRIISLPASVFTEDLF